jgi:hypothetical protein
MCDAYHISHKSFLLEGLVTVIIGVLSWGLMPPGPCQTRSWFRGKNGWFSEREEYILVNRLLRDDPSKGDMNNRFVYLCLLQKPVTIPNLKLTTKTDKQ